MKTLKDVKAAIRKADRVYVTPRFGVSEYNVRIAKAEALRWVEKAIFTDGTPENMEMFTGTFGSWIGNDLYLG